MTSKDRFIANLAWWAPLLAFFIVALPAPLIFLVLYFLATADAAVYMLLFLSSLVISSAAGLFVAIVVLISVLVYRWYWQKKLRERLAADGVTADELQWFMNELSSAERQGLKTLEKTSPLLADAYRETLAARITAARVVSKTKRELLLVERRINRVSLMRGADVSTLQSELTADRDRLERIKVEGSERRAEAEARLQMIEATASRGASWASTNSMLQRLGTMHDLPPVALEKARLEQQTLEEVENEMRTQDRIPMNLNEE
jgi:hypothetical protein